MYQVFYESRWLKIWKQCGVFNTFTLANEHIDYLIRALPRGYNLRFRIVDAFKSFEVRDLNKLAA